MMPRVCVEVPATAVVLAGGRGTRLAPVLAGRPKALAEVGGRPFLAHLLDHLAAAGVREVVLCTGHLAGQIEAAFGDAFGALRLLHSVETDPLGTAGALRRALPRLGADPVLVLNGDSLCDVDLGRYGSWHRAGGARASLVLAEVADPERYGRVQVDASGRVRGFVEKSAAPGPAWVNAGVYLLPLALLGAIPAGRAVSLEREVLPAWVGHGLHAYRSRAAFVDIGTPASYAAAAAFIAEGRLAACAS